MNLWRDAATKRSPPWALERILCGRFSLPFYLWYVHERVFMFWWCKDISNAIQSRSYIFLGDIQIILAIILLLFSVESVQIFFLLARICMKFSFTIIIFWYSGTGDVTTYWGEATRSRVPQERGIRVRIFFFFEKLLYRNMWDGNHWFIIVVCSVRHCDSACYSHFYRMQVTVACRNPIANK